MVKESLEDVVLAKESSQPQSSYEAVATLIEFELKKILIDKMDKSKSYLAAPEHKECYEGLIKSYDLDKTIFSTYGKKRKTSKDAEPRKGNKVKESQSGSSKGTKSQPKYSGKSVQSEEPEFEVVDSDMPQDQEENLGNGDEEPKDKTPQQGQNQSWLMTLASSAEKLSKTFDELTSTPIDFSAFIMNGLKINNLTQGTLLGPAFRLLKGTCSNYAELEYDFKECYKALSKKLDWENPEGDDYPSDLTKPLPLVEVMRKHGYGYLKEIVVRRADNDLYRFKECDFPCLRINDIEDMLLLVVQNWITNLSSDDVSDFAIALRMFTRSLVIQKRVEYLQLGVKSYQKKINVTKPETTKFGIRKRDPYTPYQDP
ncbi:reverse transcriptase domain-containing protein [Tanacetum coccineum]